VRKWLAVCAVLGMLGCADTRQYFRPTEHVTGETSRGEPEAIYNLVGALGPFGEAKVWSRGAFRKEGDTLLFATIELHNTSGAPIIVDPQRIRLDPVRAGKHLLRDIPPIQTEAMQVKPGAFGRVQLHFLLPPHILPGQVSAFGLRWEVANGQQTYSQRTPFLEVQPYYAYPNRFSGYPYPYYYYGPGGYCGYADPFCRWGYGGGYGYYGAWPARPFGADHPIDARPPREVIRTR